MFLNFPNFLIMPLVSASIHFRESLWCTVPLQQSDVLLLGVMYHLPNIVLNVTTLTLRINLLEWVLARLAPTYVLCFKITYYSFQNFPKFLPILNLFPYHHLFPYYSFNFCCFNFCVNNNNEAVNFIQAIQNGIYFRYLKL